MTLDIYGEYDRRAVHDIFNPTSPFTVAAGLWGIQGIIRVPKRAGDFVLFVTLGKQEGAHQFDESINDEGILRWQSQPQQDLSSPVIRELLDHDEKTNLVHLFLRSARLRGGVAPPFTYLGHLRLADFDVDRAKPAHLAWELMSWPIPEEVLAQIELALVLEPNEANHSGLSPPTAYSALVEEDPPATLSPIGEPTKSFQARKTRYQSSDHSRSLGLAGELLVLARERARFIAAQRPDLAEKVTHTSVVIGDGAGYDIDSFFTDGRSKFIEVKTTTGPKSSDFLISPNELNFSEAKPASFELCRVFAFNKDTGTARTYSLWGKMRERLSLVETQFRARPLAPI